MTDSLRADIGIFGGSGFYSFAEGGIEEIKVETPYGAPSDKIALAEVAGHRVAFLPRHGRTHSLPPHMINYRANLWAMHSLGVTRIIAPNAVGSLQTRIEPGHFVINDQFVDRTSGRKDTFYDGPITTHVSPAEPYCPQLRRLAIDATRANNITVHETGTCVIIQGPRFSTKAESQWFTSLGWEIINMTQYPEAMLARELSLCYVNISLVTDYDAGLVGGDSHVDAVSVMEVMARNTDNVKKVIRTLLQNMPEARECPCADALKAARWE